MGAKVSVFREALSYLLLVSAVLAALCSLAGCGERRPLSRVTGQVLYDGKPLQFGTVSFQPEHGQPATAVIQPDGSFSLHTVGEGSGAVVGRNLVRVACYENQQPECFGRRSTRRRRSGPVADPTEVHRLRDQRVDRRGEPGAQRAYLH